MEMLHKSYKDQEIQAEQPADVASDIKRLPRMLGLCTGGITRQASPQNAFLKPAVHSESYVLTAHARNWQLTSARIMHMIARPTSMLPNMP